MQIRKMKPNDLSAISRVNIDTFRETQREIVPDAVIKQLTYEGAEQRFQRMLHRKEQLSTIFVAKIDNSIVGYAMGGLAREEVQDYQGELYGIYIMPSYHGKGIGRRLMCSVANHLREKGAFSMFVVVFSDNLPAIKFYEALGGQRLYERTIVLGGADVLETIYGWASVEHFSN